MTDRLAPTDDGPVRPRVHVLVIENEPADYERVCEELMGSSYETVTRRAENEEEVREALAEAAWDVVIAAYKNPYLGGLDALRIIKEFGLDVPFILVSGKVGEEAAVEAMRAGAHDYLTKDRLHRLVAAVEREVREASIRQDRDRLESDVRQIQKMEAVGRLAGGIAHDFNNLLTAIRGYADLALSELTADHPVRLEIEQIRRAADRATDLTAQLLAFSRRQVVTRRVLDLNELVVRMETLLGRLIGEHIAVTTTLVPERALVRVDAGQIEQVLVNLAINARDAMPDGGRLLIETRFLELDQRYGDRHGEVAPGSYVLLSITDTGTGMDAETRARAFEPFFTTKPTGQGSGLGLATVYGIVAQNDGHVWLYSEPGHGTTFRVYLPRIAPPAEHETTEAPAAAAGGNEKILLVEDEDNVRALVREVLQRAGYEIVEAAAPEQALALAGEHIGTLRLIVTDVVMPGMTGSQLVSRLRALQPDLRVLYMSGYADDTTIRRDLLEQGVAYLQKPFAPSVLSRTVRQVLDELTS